MMRKLSALALVAQVFASTTAFAAWNVVVDKDHGYQLPIPSDYQLSWEPEGGGSRLFHNPVGDMLVTWGAELPKGDLPTEAARRRLMDEDQGWQITYERFTPNGVSYSGVLDDQIRYVRGIRYCGDRAAFFLIDYRRSEKTKYDPIITHMVRNMRATKAC